MDKIKSFCRNIKNKVTKVFREEICTYETAALFVDIILVTLTVVSTIFLAVFLSYSDTLGIMSRAKEVGV